MPWLLFFVSLVVLAIVMGAAVAMLVGSIPPENRVAPPERLADLEQARDETLARIAARQRRRV